MFIDLHYFRIGLEDDERWTLYYPVPGKEHRVLATIQSNSDEITQDLTEEEKDALIRGLITKVQSGMKMETHYMKKLKALKNRGLTTNPVVQYSNY
jgi:hypothetical protein